MGLDLGRIGAGVATLGGSEVYRGIKGYSDKKNANAQNDYQNSLYGQNQANWNQSMQMGHDLQDQLMGESGKDVGKKATELQNMLYQNINKPTITSDLYRQKSDLNLSRANAKAGLAGVDTTAGMLQEGRKGAIEASAVNEQHKQDALAQYGKSIGATQNAVANLWLGTMGMAMGSQQTPQPMQQKGILGQGLTDLGLA